MLKNYIIRGGKLNR